MEPVTRNNIRQFSEGSIHLCRALHEEYGIPLVEAMELLLAYGVLRAFAAVERVGDYAEKVEQACRHLSAITNAERCAGTQRDLEIALTARTEVLRHLRAVLHLDPLAVATRDEHAMRFIEGKEQLDVPRPREGPESRHETSPQNQEMPRAARQTDQTGS